MQLLFSVTVTRSDTLQPVVQNFEEQKLTIMSPREMKKGLKGIKTQSYHLLMRWFGKDTTRIQQFIVELDFKVV